MIGTMSAARPLDLAGVSGPTTPRASRSGQGAEIIRNPRGVTSGGFDKLTGGVVSFFGGQALLWLTEGVDITSGLGLLLTVASLAFFWQWWRERDSTTSPVIQAFLHSPERIVWVYDRAVWKGREQVGEVHVHLDTGRKTVLHFPSAVETAEVVDVFRQRASHAKIGWNRETELLFKEDASALRRPRAEA